MKTSNIFTKLWLWKIKRQEHRADVNAEAHPTGNVRYFTLAAQAKPTARTDGKTVGGQNLMFDRIH